MKILKKTAMIISAGLITVMVLSACVRFPDDHYSGDYPELFTVAVYSLLGIQGYSISDIILQPLSEVMIFPTDQDSYGRILFIYIEDSGISTPSLIISQYSSETHVYFYPHFNFISAPSDELIFEHEYGRLINIVFPEKLVDELKKKNDWGQPLNLNIAARAEIVRTKSAGPLSRNALREAHGISLGENSIGRLHYRYFDTDTYGRSIYVFSRNVNRRDIVGNHFAVVLFHPDGTFDEDLGVMELTEWFNYQEMLKEFMELNGWNQPLPHRP
ncbi:MAG: hypothetical protein FWB92_11010 [Oscillospiraceae bacterium]|nr:hypothetical protein [Oscillospiraceae bacterium]